MSLRDLSLKWKLLIPFFFLSLIGTTAFVLLSFHSQKELILHAEHDLLRRHFEGVLQSIENKSSQALALATAIAEDPVVRDAMPRRHREALLKHVLPLYRQLHDDFGVEEVHFHTPNGISFLRVHKPSVWGDDLKPYRKTIVHAGLTRRGVGGLEWGKAGYAIRGVVPIQQEGKLLGTVEVGISFGEPFVREFKNTYGVDLSLYVPAPEKADHLQVLATTLKRPTIPSLQVFRRFQVDPSVRLWTPLPGKQEISSILGPIRDYSERVVALIEIRMDRKPFLAMLERFRKWMALVEMISILLAMAAIWFLVNRFVRPIREMVKEAAEIVAGERVHIPVRRGYELGMLTKALNNMVGYLEASRQRMREYAENLEAEVIARTQELRHSEERYRNLVERVPLVVYQMKSDRTLMFVNQHVEEIFGIGPDQLVGEPGGFDQWISSKDRAWVQREFSQAIQQGREWVAEYQLQVQGRRHFVREHAVPLLDSKGQVIHVDGILVDITDQRRLQEKTLQAEELKTLGEISARLAHEIRNPLTSIGGLSRRLLKSLPEDHPARAQVNVIINEVERLERILKTILSYIEPFEIHMTHAKIDELLEDVVHGLSDEFRERKMGISWTITQGLPAVPMDPSLMRKALQTLCRHTLFLMDPGSTLKVNLTSDDGRVRLQLRYPSERLSYDDLEHYFYPFLSTDMPDAALMELPVSKIIIYKHGGLVRVDKEGREVVLTVSVPSAARQGEARPPYEV